MKEGQFQENKSLRKIVDSHGKIKTEGVRDLAVSCVAFANRNSAKLYVGIEDKSGLVPTDQIIPDWVPNDLITRLRSLCFNTGLSLNPIQKDENGGEFFTIDILYSANSIATTSDGKIYVRIGDKCEPVRSEDVARLASEKNIFQWELQTRNISINEISLDKIIEFAKGIRSSDRVKESIKQKSDFEIIEHYNLIYEGKLTNIGVLWLGNSKQRARLVYPLTVQYIVYNDLEEKIRKEDWADYDLNPKELLLDIEQRAIELTYSYEIPNGMFRNKVRQYAAKVIRELLVNSFAHKSFTIAGDIFIKVFPDRLEITNPGGLPLGVTNENILHSSVSRNPHLKRIFHDLKLMEGEGTGYDLLYEEASKDSKPFPIVYSDFNSCTAIQSSEIIDENSLILLDFINNRYALTQKECIAIGIIALHKKVASTEMSKILQLSEEERLRSYVGNLVKKNIVVTRGARKGTEYLINPKLILSSKVNVKPTLRLIEPHVLKVLITEDLKAHPNSLISDIHKRLEDVDIKDIRKIVYKMRHNDELSHVGSRTDRRYSLPL